MTAREIAIALGGRRAGNGWLARCPAHEDRSPSLSISDVDGRVLIHCHAGCKFEDIVAAVGMRPTDLFPPTQTHGRPIPRSQRWVPRQVLDAISSEALVVVVAAETLADGGVLTEADRTRLRQATERIRASVNT